MADDYTPSWGVQLGLSRSALEVPNPLLDLCTSLPQHTRSVLSTSVYIRAYLLLAPVVLSPTTRPFFFFAAFLAVCHRCFLRRLLFWTLFSALFSRPFPPNSEHCLDSVFCGKNAIGRGLPRPPATDISQKSPKLVCCGCIAICALAGRCWDGREGKVCGMGR